jgi:hypothetical protein
LSHRLGRPPRFDWRTRFSNTFPEGSCLVAGSSPKRQDTDQSGRSDADATGDGSPESSRPRRGVRISLATLVALVSLATGVLTLKDQILGDEPDPPPSAEQPPAPSGQTKYCGQLVESGAGTYDVQGTGVECALARQVAREWQQQCATQQLGASQPGGACTVSAGYECETQREAAELAIIRCTDGTREVKLSFGA